MINFPSQSYGFLVLRQTCLTHWVLFDSHGCTFVCRGEHDRFNI